MLGSTCLALSWVVRPAGVELIWALVCKLAFVCRVSPKYVKPLLTPVVFLSEAHRGYRVWKQKVGPPDWGGEGGAFCEGCWNKDPVDSWWEPLGGNLLGLSPLPGGRDEGQRSWWGALKCVPWLVGWLLSPGIVKEWKGAGE